MKDVNCRADYRFQVDILTPNAAGDLAAPALGQITDVTLRLSATPDGPALDPSLDGLTATEAPEKPGRFYAVVDRTLLTAHVLPLGVGARFYAIWSKAGDLDQEAIEFRVADGRVQSS